MDFRADPKAIFRANSRSFSLAASFFQPSDQKAVARLYRFCRYLDNLADDTLDGDVAALDLAYARLTRKVDIPGGSIEADFLALSSERSIPLEPALVLLRALRDDCGPRSIETIDELIQFAYGVAGTVGQMLRYVVDAKDTRADAFATDLGIALQLSNILRDVTEDSERGRFYLPAEWVTPIIVQKALNGHADASREVLIAIARTHALAEKFYQSANKGMAYIPSRNRRVIFFASKLYREIGNKVLYTGKKSLSIRTVVSFPTKIRVGFISLLSYRHWKIYQWQTNPEPSHEPIDTKKISVGDYHV